MPTRTVAGRFRCFTAIAAALCLLAASGVAWAYPTPSRVSTRWQLKFEPGPLRLYRDGTDYYWYMTYKVVNYSGRERYWAPRFTIFTDSGDIVDSGQGVPTRVEQDLISLLGNEFLERQNQVIGKIFVGEPNAIEGLVVWPASDLKVTQLSVFISGISGETAEITNPQTGEKQYMQKTLQRDYVVPGDARARGDDPVEIEVERWVMR